jgi:hypothetical protein
VNARTRREDLLPTPPYTKGVCHEEPCHTRLITAEIYIEDALYRLVREFLHEENVTGNTNDIVNQRIGIKRHIRNVEFLFTY